MTQHENRLVLDKSKCYLCEKLCFNESVAYNQCEYRKKKSFGCLENRTYEEACTRLAVKFGKKHGWRFTGWVGLFKPEKHNWYEGAGGWAQYDSDDVVSMDDLRTDLIMDAHPDAYQQYMDASVEEGFQAQREGREPRYVNYRSWLWGERHNPEESTSAFLKLREKQLSELKARLEQERKELEEELQRLSDELQAGSDGCY